VLKLDHKSQAVHLYTCAQKVLEKEFPHEYLKLARPSTSTLTSATSSSTAPPTSPLAASTSTLAEENIPEGATVCMRGTSVSGLCCEGVACKKAVSLQKVSKVEITLSDGQGGGGKLYWCEHNHFKLGGHTHLKEYQLRLLERMKALPDMPMTVVCTGCGDKCTTKLRLATAQRPFFFCMPDCIVSYISLCTVGKWKEITKKIN
jgi:hypothetical protein